MWVLSMVMTLLLTFPSLTSHLQKTRTTDFQLQSIDLIVSINVQRILAEIILSSRDIEFSSNLIFHIRSEKNSVS